MLLSIVVHVHWCMPRPRVWRDPAEEGKVLQAAARDVARPARDRQAQQQQRAQHIACDERCPFEIQSIAANASTSCTSQCMHLV